MPYLPDDFLLTYLCVLFIMANAPPPPPPSEAPPPPPQGPGTHIRAFGASQAALRVLQVLICGCVNAVSGPFPNVGTTRVQHADSVYKIVDRVYLEQTVSADYRLQFLWYTGKREWCRGKWSGISELKCPRGDVAHGGGLGGGGCWTWD